MKCMEKLSPVCCLALEILWKVLGSSVQYLIVRTIESSHTVGSQIWINAHRTAIHADYGIERQSKAIDFGNDGVVVGAARAGVMLESQLTVGDFIFDPVKQFKLAGLQRFTNIRSI